MDVPSWALEAIKALGVAGGPVFAFLWWLERRERQACQIENKAFSVQVLTAINQTTNSIIVVRDAVVEARGATRDSVNTLSQLIRSIKKVGGS